MAIKYSRLISDEFYGCNPTRWAKKRLPLAFIKQQIVLIAIVSTSSFLLILTTFFTPDVEYDLIKDEPNFGVVVDCGSSGTRAHIFTWTRDNHGWAQVGHLRDNNGKPYTMHIMPGLSSLHNEPEGASDYMAPIMDFISRSIPTHRHVDTPVSFMATAGMRLLEESIQKSILSDITRDLRAKYNFPRIRGQVITGEYEGIYSWLSLNKRRIHNNMKGPKSIGMIELGGASTQVTYELDNDIDKLLIRNIKSDAAVSTFLNEQVTLDLHNNSSVKLFATTFLGLGVNSARESAIDVLVRDYLNGTGQLVNEQLTHENFEIRLKDPCLTTGSSELVQRPEELIKSNEHSLGFSMKQGGKAVKVMLEGSGNFLNCITLLERVIKLIKVERLNCSPSQKACPMELLGNDFIPYQHYPFVGLSEMFFTTNEMMHSSGVFNRTRVLRETKRICSTGYNNLLELYSNGGVSHEDRILYECFKASWVLTILHNSGLKMPVRYNEFKTVDQLEGEIIDWTIGAMIWELNLNRD